ncbi:MAG: glycosyltransferase [Desulfobacteraceae bacterium]|nr:glycosyltransferase [Desulfobacteraceae bacterium]
MVISVIIGSFYPAVIYGGPVFTALYSTQELARLGAKVYVSTTNANGNDVLDVETNKFLSFENNLLVKYYSGANKNGNSFNFCFNVWKDIKQADIVHIQAIFSFWAVVALFYAFIFRLPVLLTPHGCLGAWCVSSKKHFFKKVWLSIFVKPFLKKLYFHATSDQELTDIHSYFPDASVFTVPNGINLEEFNTINKLTRSDLVYKFTGTVFNPKYVITSLGRIDTKKGYDILIDSFHALKNILSESVILIAGQDYGAKNDLLLQIEKLGLQNNVFLIGHIDGQDKIDFLANGDLFVLPSHNENFGLVYAESLAAGTPVIASTNTPWADIERFNCGKWVPNTVTETAAAISTMLNSDLETMGHNGKRFVADNFSWPAIAYKLLKVLSQINGSGHE